MSGSDKTSLGDRMKSYERRYALKVLPMIPIIARIDGRGFSKFTSGLARPYDERMSRLMIDVTKFLVEETNACCGYTQSDEISLVWITEDPEAKIFFDGKLLKMTSVVGSLATAKFNKLLPERLPEKAHLLPVFDNRIWEVPSMSEAVNYFIWREQDATRNSIQGAARAHFSHNQCQNKNGSQLQEMLWKKGINWNDYPAGFKRGTYIRRFVAERTFTEEEIKKFPPQHEAVRNPNVVVKRTVIKEENMPPLAKIINRENVVFSGENPIVGEMTKNEALQILE